MNNREKFNIIGTCYLLLRSSYYWDMHSIDPKTSKWIKDKYFELIYDAYLAETKNDFRLKSSILIGAAMVDALSYSYCLADNITPDMLDCEPHCGQLSQLIGACQIAGARASLSYVANEL